MSGMKSSQNTEERSLDPQTVILALSIFAILVPAGISIVSDPNTGLILYMELVFMFWTINIVNANPNPPGTFQDVTTIPETAIPNPLMFIGNLPLTFLRIVFVYQMYRCYQNRTTTKRTVLVGAASELQASLIGNLSMLIPVFSLFSHFFIPIPALFLAGLVMIKMAPPPQNSIPWKHQEESESWWARESEDKKITAHTIEIP
jgi:hypothetical protein